MSLVSRHQLEQLPLECITECNEYHANDEEKDNVITFRSLLFKKNRCSGDSRSHRLIFFKKSVANHYYFKLRLLYKWIT